MNCQRLAAEIQRLQPQATTHDVARLCLLLTNTVDDLTEFEDQALLCQAWQNVTLRLQAIADQHEAMTEDLESITRANGEELTAEQILILLRALKVQHQVLDLYLGKPAVSR